MTNNSTSTPKAWAPQFLGALVVVAGAGYLADSFARILIPDFQFTIGLFTFVGEALLIVWLIMRAIKGFDSDGERPGGKAAEPRFAPPTPVAP